MFEIEVKNREKHLSQNWKPVSIYSTSPVYDIDTFLDWVNGSKNNLLTYYKYRLIQDGKVIFETD